jgi:hypothetical protein
LFWYDKLKYIYSHIIFFLSWSTVNAKRKSRFLFHKIIICCCHFFFCSKLFSINMPRSCRMSFSMAEKALFWLNYLFVWACSFLLLKKELCWFHSVVWLFFCPSVSKPQNFLSEYATTACCYRPLFQYCCWALIYSFLLYIKFVFSGGFFTHSSNCCFPWIVNNLSAIVGLKSLYLIIRYWIFFQNLILLTQFFEKCYIMILTCDRGENNEIQNDYESSGCWLLFLTMAIKRLPLNRLLVISILTQCCIIIVIE